MRGRQLLLAATLFAVGCAHGAPASSAEPSRLEVLGNGPRISMARIRLGPGEELGLAAGRCQDISVFVENGAIRAGVDPGSSIERGEAMRFSASARLQADRGKGAELFAVAVLSDATSEQSVDWNRAPENEACPSPATPHLVSDPDRSGPFMHAGNRLAVMIYLDAAGSERPVPSFGTLAGAPTLAVPEHTHEHSAEVLWIQEGSGTMRVGDETRPIRPGTFVYVPPKTIHGFEPDGSSSLFAYQVYTPAGPERRFRNADP